MSLTVRRAAHSDLEAVAHVYTLARPGNPATAELLLAEDDAQQGAGAVHVRWLAERGGEVVGAAEVQEPLGSRAAGNFQMELAVLQTRRGQGVGTLLYRALKSELALHAPRRLGAVVSEANPIALHFARKHGFAEVERFWDRTLELSGFDVARYARPLPEGVELVTLARFAQTVPDVVAVLHPVNEEARADLPRASGEVYTPLPRSDMTHFLAPLDPALLLLATQHGRPVGFTALGPSGAPGELMIAMTGVLRSHRRLGLARALKLASIEAARRAGWAVIRTTNHSGNLGMLKVNDALGFGREPARLGMMKRW
ncbi:N-acetyltransferase family protein [Deinococcus sp.]|uniref:GNAT family N-acetyltransferase n=1 Tax=Deinococcus sp. TaxID=47478 RepID=UPI003C7AAB12